MFDYIAFWVFVGALVVTVLFVGSGWYGEDRMANRMLERLVRRVKWQESDGEDW